MTNIIFAEKGARWRLRVVTTDGFVDYYFEVFDFVIEFIRTRLLDASLNNVAVYKLDNFTNTYHILS